MSYTLPFFGKGKSSGGGAVRPIDPLNVDNQLSPSEREGYVSYVPEAEERAVIDLVRERFQAAAEARRPIERDWMLAIGMYEGNQTNGLHWQTWEDATHKAVSLMVEGQEHRYITRPLVKPLFRKVVGLSCQNQPDAQPAPQTDSELDRAAASEARCIDAHLARLFKDGTMRQRLALWAALCGVVYKHHYWDPNAFAAVPILDNTGQVTSKQKLPVGEHAECLKRPFDIYLDTQATDYEEAGWLIDASIQSLDYIQKRWPKKGRFVEGENLSKAAAWQQTYLSDGYGAASQLKSYFARGKSKSALVLVMYEKSSLLFGKGRYIVVAGDVLVESRAWDEQEFPYSRLVFEEALGHPYGTGLMASVAPLQVDLNRNLTNIARRLEADKDVLLVETGAEIGADAYEIDGDDSDFLKVMYKTGANQPSWQRRPGAGVDIWRYIDQTWEHMQHMVGIHDANLTGAPQGLTAGISIALAQEGDRTQLGLFAHQIEQWAVTDKQLRIRSYAKFASPYLPRLMGLDDSGNPATARTRAMAFRALTGGGSVDIVVREGSAIPRSPAGEKQEILELANADLLNPANPQSDIVVRLYSLPESAQVLDWLQQARTEMAQAQADQAKAAQDAQDESMAKAAQTQDTLEANKQQRDTQGKIQLAAVQHTGKVGENQQAHQQDLEKALIEQLLGRAFGAPEDGVPPMGNTNKPKGAPSTKFAKRFTPMTPKAPATI
jgi:hypothetical protein